MRSTHEVLAQLNAYDMSDPESNIWGDIILMLDEYDEEATNALQTSASDRFILTNGDTVRWSAQAARWHRVHAMPESEPHPASRMIDESHERMADAVTQALPQLIRTPVLRVPAPGNRRKGSRLSNRLESMADAADPAAHPVTPRTP